VLLGLGAGCISEPPEQSDKPAHRGQDKPVSRDPEGNRGDEILNTFVENGQVRQLTRGELERLRRNRSVPIDRIGGKLIWNQFGVAWRDLGIWALALAINPKGDQVAVGSSGVVVILDLKSLRPRRTFEVPKVSVRGMDWSPDGKYLALGSPHGGPKYPGNVHVYTPEGKRIRTLGRFRSTVASVEFSPDGKHLAAMDVSGRQEKGFLQLGVWRVSDWQTVIEYKDLALGEVSKWDMHWVDSTTFLFASDDGFFLRSLSSKKHTRISELNTARFCVGASWVLAHQMRKQRRSILTLYRLTKGCNLQVSHRWEAKLTEDLLPEQGLVMGTNQRFAYGAGMVGNVGVLDLKKRKNALLQRFHQGTASAALTRDGRYFVTVGDEGTVSVVDVKKLLQLISKKN